MAAPPPRATSILRHNRALAQPVSLDLLYAVVATSLMPDPYRSTTTCPRVNCDSRHRISVKPPELILPPCDALPPTAPPPPAYLPRFLPYKRVTRIPFLPLRDFSPVC